MVSHKVRQGDVGVSMSCTKRFVLLQTTDPDGEQARVVMTIEETKDVINRLEEVIKAIEKTKT